MNSTSTLPRRSVLRFNSISIVGAAFGLFAFVMVGVFPALVVGGSLGARLASGILGVRSIPGSATSAMMTLGALSTTIVGAAFFLALGAAAGAVLDALTGARERRQVAR